MSEEEFPRQYTSSSKLTKRLRFLQQSHHHRYHQATPYLTSTALNYFEPEETEYKTSVTLSIENPFSPHFESSYPPQRMKTRRIAELEKKWLCCQKTHHIVLLISLPFSGLSILVNPGLGRSSSAIEDDCNNSSDMRSGSVGLS